MKLITKDHKHFEFSKDVKPAERAASGETIVFEAEDCYDGQIEYDGKDFRLLDMKRNNPVTGPLFVDGAEPGDVLKVEILDIELPDHGVMCVRTGCGIYEVNGCHCRKFDIKNGKIYFDEDIVIGAEPMIGVIGTAPSDRTEPTQCPGEHGGNLDMKELGAGSTVYLPVAVKGALLSLGDLHAVQGDGESVICGMEIGGKVALRATVLKPAEMGCRLPLPFIETEDAVYTVSADESLDVCSQAAARKMHRYLMENFRLTDAQAAMLLSLKGDLRITQVVNPLKGCMMAFPKEMLAQLQ